MQKKIKLAILLIKKKVNEQHATQTGIYIIPYCGA